MEKYRGSLGVTITGGLAEVVIPWAGAALLVELYRRAGIGAVADRALPRKKSAKGLRQGQMVESFVLLSALGGDCPSWEGWRDYTKMKGWRQCLVIVHQRQRQPGNG